MHSDWAHYARAISNSPTIGYLAAALAPSGHANCESTHWSRRRRLRLLIAHQLRSILTASASTLGPVRCCVFARNRTGPTRSDLGVTMPTHKRSITPPALCPEKTSLNCIAIANATLAWLANPTASIEPAGNMSANQRLTSGKASQPHEMHAAHKPFRAFSTKTLDHIIAASGKRRPRTAMGTDLASDPVFMTPKPASSGPNSGAHQPKYMRGFSLSPIDREEEAKPPRRCARVCKGSRSCHVTQTTAVDTKHASE